MSAVPLNLPRAAIRWEIWISTEIEIADVITSFADNLQS